MCRRETVELTPAGRLVLHKQPQSNTKCRASGLMPADVQ